MKLKIYAASIALQAYVIFSAPTGDVSSQPAQYRLACKSIAIYNTCLGQNTYCTTGGRIRSDYYALCGINCDCILINCPQPSPRCAKDALENQGKDDSDSSGDDAEVIRMEDVQDGSN